MKNNETLVPYCAFQGAGLTVRNGLQVGNEMMASAPVAPVVGMNYAERMEEKINTILLRPCQDTVKVDAEPSTMQFNFRYEQRGALAGKRVVFRLLSDPEGYLVGSSFAADVSSNYPGDKMSLPKTKIPSGNFGIFKDRELPEDYWADITVRYWAGKGDNVDAWMFLEVGYLDDEVNVAAYDAAAVPMIILTRARLFPNLRGKFSPLEGWV